MPQERLPKNLEKKLIHTPSNQLNPITSSTTPTSGSIVASSHVVTCSSGVGVASISNISASVSPQIGQSPSQQFVLSNNNQIPTVRPLGPQEQSQPNQAQPRYQLSEDQIQQLINQPLSQQQQQQQQPLIRQSDSLSIQSQSQQIPSSSAQAGQPGFLNKILLDGCKSMPSKQLPSTLNTALIGWDKQSEKKGNTKMFFFGIFFFISFDNFFINVLTFDPLWTLSIWLLQ